MAIFDLFSKRQKKKRGEFSDVYQYESLDQSFKVQVVHIVRETIGIDSGYASLSKEAYENINRILCKEYGVFSLRDGARSNFEAIFDYFLNENKCDNCLDVIDLVFSVIDVFVRNESWGFRGMAGVLQSPDDAITELNYRFKEAGIGYQFESGELVRVDSQFVHSEVVRPVLYLLGKDEKYAGANDEFLSAHEHYRHKRYK